MRGSPLLRTVVLLLFLAAAGVGLRQLTGQHAVAAARVTPPGPAPAPAAPAAGRHSVPFELVLSGVPAAIRLADADGTALYESTAPAVRQAGALPLPAGETTVFLEVRWAANEPGRRFAKLTLEPPARPTLQRFFDADGEIDDAWEIPAAPARHD
jgi:hypothetical protein